MKGLILKDLYYLKNNVKVVLTMTVFYAVMFMKGESYLMGVAMASLMVGVLTTGTISSDEKNNWDKYALTMPLTRKKITQEKYLLINSIVILTFVMLMIITLVILGIPTVDELLKAVIVLSLLLIILNMQIYMINKFGSEKAVIYFFIVFGTIIGLVFGLNKLFPNIVSGIMSFASRISITSLTLGAIAFTSLMIFISYKLSLKRSIDKEY